MRPDPVTIQVRIHDLRQFFNSIDPSPFRERDLDPECEEFIVSWARETPPERSLRLEIRVDGVEPTAQQAADVTSAVHSHFNRAASMQDLRRRRITREGRLSLGIGSVALVLCEVGAALVPVAALGTAGEILRDGLIIAGWVVMWHPLETLLYGVWPVVRERRLLERLASAEVRLTSVPTAAASETSSVPAAPGFA